MEYVYQRPKLYAKQEEAFFNPQRFSVILGSTKSGKSVAALAWLFEQALHEAKKIGAYWWLAPTHRQAQVMYKRLKAYIPEYLFRANDTDMTLVLANNNILRFTTAENVDNLFGEDVHALVCDEASRCREEVWQLIRSVLTATQGPARLVANVRGRNWYWQLYQRYKQSPDPNYGCYSINAWDAVEGGVIPREEIEDAQASLPETIFNELYLNIPSDEGSNPFGLKAIANCVRPLSDGPPVVWGWDLAKSLDWTVGIALDQFGQVCAFHRWQGPWEATTQRILDITGQLPALVDSSGVGDPIVEQLAKGRPNFQGFKFTQGSKQQLMEGLAVGIHNGQCRFPDGIVRHELETFEFEYTKTGVRYTAPPGLHDDCVIALALAWSHYMKPKNMYLLDMLDQL